MTRWRPALRMARRDLWTHKGRSLLMLILVALPVFVAVAVAQFHHNLEWDGEQAARAEIGGADAAIEVTPYNGVQVTYWPSLSWMPLGKNGEAVRGERVPKVQRDASEVDLSALLPKGTRIIDGLGYGEVTLDTGGTANVKVIDASDPMAEGLAGVSAGSAPTGPDEVALAANAAKALHLLDEDGAPQPEARLHLIDGTALKVVGVIDSREGQSFGGGVEMLAAPSSIMATRGVFSEPTDSTTSYRYLVDLPDTSVASLHELAASLAADGVAILPRDVFFHPQAWNVQNHSSGPVDATALAIGALVVLFGLIEVVLLVGSAFAVGARRQVRDLGLVAANGGAAGDVRTVLLAQGLVLGVGASVLGALMGLLAFRLGVPMYEVMAHRRVWAQDIDWLSVTGLTLLGATTGLIAALAPAWSISRVSVVDALSGRFAVDEKELRTHRPAVAIALFGLVVLVASGWWTAAEFAERADTSTYDVGYEVPPSPIPLVVGAIGLLLLIGGVTWTAPHVVRRVASGSRFLSVSGRFALREASRHRFRTAASAVTLMITVAGMLFAGFAVQAASAQVARDTSSFGPRWMSVWLGPEGPDPAADAQRVTSVVDAIHDQLGDAQTLVSYLPSLPDKPDYVPFLGTGDAPDPGVHVVDQDALVQLVEADADILDVFADGGIITTSPDAVKDGRVHVAVDPPGKKHDETWKVAAIYAEPTELGSGLDMPGSWMSEATAADLGFVVTPTTVTVVAERDITSEELDALAVQGITGSSVVRELERVGLIRFAALGAAGLLTLLVVGIAIALASAEGRADQATMAAVGAGPRQRRRVGAMHGMFIGLVGALLGAVIGIPAGAALMQVDGASGTSIPWLLLLGLLLVPSLAWVAGWLATSTRLTMVRRAD